MVKLIEIEAFRKQYNDIKDKMECKEREISKLEDENSQLSDEKANLERKFCESVINYFKPNMLFVKDVTTEKEKSKVFVIVAQTQIYQVDKLRGRSSYPNVNVIYAELVYGLLGELKLHFSPKNKEMLPYDLLLNYEQMPFNYIDLKLYKSMVEKCVELNFEVSPDQQALLDQIKNLKE